MRLLLTLAMIGLATGAARAETFSFSFGGQSIQIGIAPGCSDMSCVSINVPGYYSHNSNSSEPRRATRQQPRPQEQKRVAKPKPAKPATEQTVAAAPAKPGPTPEATSAPAQPARSAMVSEPVPPAPATRSLAPAVTASPVPAPVQESKPQESKPVAESAPGVTHEPPAAAGPALDPQAIAAALAPVTPPPAEAPAEVAAAPAAPEPAPAAAKPEADSKQMVIAALPPPKPEAEDRAKETVPQAIGMWSGSDGKLKIEPCGQYLCGYAAGGKHAGKMILINMRQTKANHWSGRVRDFGSGGVYSASMFMRGANSLRIQGCAFGGMICDGRTLARSN